MLKNREQVVITLPPELRKWIKEQAEKECRPLGRMIEYLIAEYKNKIEETEK